MSTQQDLYGDAPSSSQAGVFGASVGTEGSGSGGCLLGLASKRAATEPWCEKEHVFGASIVLGMSWGFKHRETLSKFGDSYPLSEKGTFHALCMVPAEAILRNIVNCFLMPGHDRACGELAREGAAVLPNHCLPC